MTVPVFPDIGACLLYALVLCSLTAGCVRLCLPMYRPLLLGCTGFPALTGISMLTGQLLILTCSVLAQMSVMFLRLRGIYRVMSFPSWEGQ